ncbi:MAG: winged helix-turn-helix domain-containing protein [Oricola sp.]
MTQTIESAGPNIARLAALLADPARAQIMLALMDGRALTAGELARAGGVSPQTTSSHLARLIDGGLLAVASQGRHRYYRISGPDAAHLVETLSVLSHSPDPARIRAGPRDANLREARICYDHLAGTMGVRLLDGLRGKDALAGDDSNVNLTAKGEQVLSEFGIDLDALKGGKRPLCRACLDWSERRPHLAGSVGAAVLEKFLDEGWIRRQAGTRTLMFSGEGLRRFDCLAGP